MDVWTAGIPGYIERSIYVEAAEPHRIIRWQSNTGAHAELLGSVRMKYWEMNREGFERSLSKLGLLPRPPRTT